MSLEYEQGLGEDCSCKRPPEKPSAKRDTRCVDCHASPLSCQACFVEAHRFLPFHWAHVWESSFFKRKSFSELGGVLNLGHGGSPCNKADAGHTQKLIIAHVNGVHTIDVLYCECFCIDNPRWEQLLRHRLFPATMKRPHTAFTMELLTFCHRLSMDSKAVMYDISTILRRITNEAFERSVPVSLS